MNSLKITGSPPRMGRSFAAELYKPYLTLEEPTIPSALMAFGPILAYRARGDAVIGALGLQRILAPAFRINLARETREWKSWQDPRGVHTSERSALWRNLCDALDGFDCLSDPDKVWLLKLLVHLGYHRLVLSIVKTPSPQEISHSQDAAGIAHLRAFARFMNYTGHWIDYDPYDEREVLDHADPSSRPFHEAAKALLVYEGKARGDAVAARGYADLMAKFARADSSTKTPFQQTILLSAYYRAISYVPSLTKNFEAMTDDMAQSESLARHALEIANTPDEKLVARDNMHPVLESRMREALIRNDLDLALERITEVCTVIDPWDSKVHIERAELLLRTGAVEEATREYRLAALLGPPGIEIALFGAAFGSILDAASARATRLLIDALLRDPLGVSSIEELVTSAAEVGIRSWASAMSIRQLEVVRAS